MKKVFYLLVILNSCLYAQNERNTLVDSLLKLVNKEKADSNKVAHLNTISWEYQFTNLDSALYYGQQALELANKLKWQKGVAKSYSFLAVFYKSKGDAAKALQYNFTALQAAKAMGNKNAIASILCNIGIIYKDKSAYPKALTYFFDALKTAESVNNQRLMGIIQSNMGNIYTEQASYPEALRYTRHALTIAGQLEDIELQANTLGNIGLIHFLQRQYDSALVYYFKTLPLDEAMGNKNAMALHIENIASVYLEQNQYEKALEFYFKALNMNREIGNKIEETRSLGNIGYAYGFLKNYKEAESYLQKALALADELDAISQKKDFEYALSEMYEKKGDTGNALKAYKKFIAIRDSIFNKENTKKQTQQEMQYEFDKKQIAEKAEQDKKDAIAVEEKQKQSLITWAVSGVLLLVLVFSVFIYNRFTVTKKQKQIIEEQKIQVDGAYHLLHEKNKEIMDSINYAERIQRSFLATKQLLDEHLDNYFILFKPKDVVSGDFYWAARLRNGNFALATADSTGHGVPGAIMSLLNITSLERAIDNYTEPSEILNATRKTIIERLKKDGSAEGGKDGMDASLTVYDFKNKKLVVAAANNPVWIVRSVTSSEVEKHTPSFDSAQPDRPTIVSSSSETESSVSRTLLDTSLLSSGLPEVTTHSNPQHSNPSPEKKFEVIEIKPDKMPVGKHDKEAISFTQQEIQLQSGDVVYALTDGFPDQFGGEKGKKFMSKNLRELLAKHAHLPMQAQKEKLEEAFKKWVGELEQVDDVTIVGIKI